jgi:hypothetical protein
MDHLDRLVEAITTDPEKLTIDDPEAFMRRNWLQLAAGAWHGYQQTGRGAVIYEAGHARKGDPLTKHLSYAGDYKPVDTGEPIEEWRAKLRGMIEYYDPETEIVFMLDQGDTSWFYCGDGDIDPPEAHRQVFGDGASPN